MAVSSALGRLLSRECPRRIAFVHRPIVAQQRRSSNQAYAVYTPKAEARGSPAPSKPRWQTQQRLSPNHRGQQTGGILLLDTPKALAQVPPVLSDFVDALTAQDLESIWTTFDALHKSDPLAIQHISLQNHTELLRLCNSQRPNIQKGTLDKHWIERFALLAQAGSQTGDTKFIFGWFKLLLKLNQPEKVIELWNDLVASTIAAQSKTPASATPNPADNAEETDSPDSPDLPEPATAMPFMTFGLGTEGHQVEVHDIACLVIFACHLSKRPNDIVRCFEQLELGTPFRTYFSLDKARRLYKDLGHDVDIAAFVEWLSVKPLFGQAELARGLSSGSGGPNRLARLMGSLFQFREIDAAFNLFESAMKASSGPEAWLAVEGAPVPHGVPAKRVQWTDSCWSVCLSELIALGATDQAMKVWSHHHAKKLTPTPRVWNSLLDGYARVRKYEAAVATWEQIIKLPESNSQGAFPDVQMFTTMINVLFRTRKADEALALFEELKRRDAAHPGMLDVGVLTYNTVVHGLFYNGRTEHAKQLLEQMRSTGPQPNASTINTLLRSHARVGDLASLAATLRLLGELKLTPDVVTFTTVLDALLRKGGDSANESVVKVLRIMDTFDVKPNAVTYTAMIKACFNGADAGNMDAVTQGLSPNRKSATPTSSSGTSASVEAALMLLERMIESRVPLNEVTYSAMIGGCMQHPDAVADAFHRDVVPRRYKSPPKLQPRLLETQETVRQWQRRTPHISISLLLVDQLKARRLPMPTPLYHYLIDGLCSTYADDAAFHRALDLIDDMLLRSSISSSSSRGGGRDADRAMGPMLSSVRDPQAAPQTDVYTINHTSWVVILTSLLNRVEARRGTGGQAAVLQALSAAVKLVWAMGTLGGSEGGQTLSRLVRRAAELTDQRSLIS